MTSIVAVRLRGQLAGSHVCRWGCTSTPAFFVAPRRGAGRAKYSGRAAVTAAANMGEREEQGAENEFLKNVIVWSSPVDVCDVVVRQNLRDGSCEDALITIVRLCLIQISSRYPVYANREESCLNQERQLAQREKLRTLGSWATIATTTTTTVTHYHRLHGLSYSTNVSLRLGTVF